MTTTITRYDDMINMSDITDRVEEIRELLEVDEAEEGLKEELAMLEELLEETRGNGGDHQWLGDWYPGYLIRDSYFEDYARDLADNIGAVKDDADWPNRHIDWKAAAEELQQDYTSVEYEGITYWYR